VFVRVLTRWPHIDPISKKGGYGVARLPSPFLLMGDSLTIKVAIATFIVNV